MADYEKEVIEKLAAANCTFQHRGKGDHNIWYSQRTNKTFPVDSEIKSRHTANAIMKQAGLKFRFK